MNTIWRTTQKLISLTCTNERSDNTSAWLHLSIIWNIIVVSNLRVYQRSCARSNVNPIPPRIISKSLGESSVCMKWGTVGNCRTEKILWYMVFFSWVVQNMTTTRANLIYGFIFTWRHIPFKWFVLSLNTIADNKTNFVLRAYKSTYCNII